MPCAERQLRRALRLRGTLALGACALLPFSAQAQQQNPADAPAAVPASVATAQVPATPRAPQISAHDKRAADDAYLAGAKAIDRHDYAAAEQHFARAAQLNPTDSDYLRAFAFAREARVTELVRQATLARRNGDRAHADSLLAEAHTLDPDNRIVAQHLSNGGDVASPALDPLRFPAENIASTLAGAPELAPRPERHTFHERGDAQTVLRNVYAAFGIRTEIDPSVNNVASNTRPQRFDLEDVTFDQATSTLHTMTKSFAVPVQPDLALIAANTVEQRERLLPQVEETVYVRGMTNDQMQELANIARNVFELKSVTASAAAGTILLRGDEPTLKLVNAQYADLLDGSSDVLMDVSLYEIDRTRTRNFGVTLPSGASGFALETQFQNAITQNQSAINAAVSQGLLTLTGVASHDLPLELAFLAGAGLLSGSQLSLLNGFLGTIGNYNHLPLAGVAISSGATVAALLQTSDARLLDTVILRSSHLQPATFRSGTRYPIVTSTYTSGISSSASAALSGININGVSAASLASQYLGSSVTVPQIQFEDLGLTLKTTPKIQRNRDINLQIDFKIEALGATSLNNIPVLNNRQFSSTVTVPAGQTALLVSRVNTSEIKSVTGIPGLNDLPGFSGTEKNSEKDSAELIISITPHIVREQAFHTASRRLAVPRVSINPLD